jgi:hypothetical protein
MRRWPRSQHTTTSNWEKPDASKKEEGFEAALGASNGRRRRRALSPRVRQSAHTSQERFAFVRARRSQRYAGETVLFFMKRPDSDRHNGKRAGSGGGIAGAAGGALNPYKQVIFPHGRVIKSALVCCGIGGM